MVVGLGPGHFVLDRDPVPQKGGTKPHFSTMPIVAKRLCIKMPHMDKEVGLGPDDIVLDGDPAPPPQNEGGAPPKFLAHVYCGQTAGWIKMVVSIDVGLSLGNLC